jgi:hypothetical protein
MTITTWGIYLKASGIQLRDLRFASEAEAQAQCDRFNAEYAALARSPKAVERWAHLNGRFYVPVSPEQQMQWALVDFSR